MLSPPLFLVETGHLIGGGRRGFRDTGANVQVGLGTGVPREETGGDLAQM